MEFKFAVNDVFRQPIVKIGPNMVPPGFSGDRRAFWDVVAKVSEVVNSMGEASAAAQGLTKPITTAERLRNSEHTIYLLVDQNAANGRGAVTGMLKTGKKGLYVFDRNGQHYQVSPPCVLDFYVHESRQRTGLGKRLYEHMLQAEGVEPVNMAIDRPSEKFLGFLNKHYSLNEPVKQMNNYVVFDGFFPTSQEKNGTVELDQSGSTPGKKQSANGLQTTSYASPLGRYGAPRPPCSMGQIIHNQTSTIPKNTEPTGIEGVRSAPETNYQKFPNNSPGYPNISQSTPNVYYRSPQSVLKLDGLYRSEDKKGEETNYYQQSHMFTGGNVANNPNSNYVQQSQLIDMQRQNSQAASPAGPYSVAGLLQQNPNTVPPQNMQNFGEQSTPQYAPVQNAQLYPTTYSNQGLENLPNQQQISVEQTQVQPMNVQNALQAGSSDQQQIFPTETQVTSAQYTSQVTSHNDHMPQPQTRGAQNSVAPSHIHNTPQMPTSGSQQPLNVVPTTYRAQNSVMPSHIDNTLQIPTSGVQQPQNVVPTTYRAQNSVMPPHIHNTLQMPTGGSQQPPNVVPTTYGAQNSVIPPHIQNTTQMPTSGTQQPPNVVPTTYEAQNSVMPSRIYHNAQMPAPGSRQSQTVIPSHIQYAAPGSQQPQTHEAQNSIMPSNIQYTAPGSQQPSLYVPQSPNMTYDPQQTVQYNESVPVTNASQSQHYLPLQYQQRPYAPTYEQNVEQTQSVMNNPQMQQNMPAQGQYSVNTFGATSNMTNNQMIPQPNISNQMIQPNTVPQYQTQKVTHQVSQQNIPFSNISERNVTARQTMSQPNAARDMTNPPAYQNQNIAQTNSKPRPQSSQVQFQNTNQYPQHMEGDQLKGIDMKKEQLPVRNAQGDIGNLENEIAFKYGYPPQIPKPLSHAISSNAISITGR